MTIQDQSQYQTIKLRKDTHRKLRILAAQNGESMLDLMDRLIKGQETQSVITISSGTYSVSELARIVASNSKRGEWADGPDSTHIEDWIKEGDFDGSETIESLRTEWDE